MTVIAFDGKTMASDSLCTIGDFRLTNTPKLFSLKGGGILGTAGDDDCRELIQLLDMCKDQDDLPSRVELGDTHTDFTGLLYLPNKRLYYIYIWTHDVDHRVWDGVITEIRAPIAAVGHGADFALGAMQVGADAKKAVEAACQWSRFCEPPVQTMHVSGYSPKRKATLKTVTAKKVAKEVDTTAKNFQRDINKDGGTTVNIGGQKFQVKAVDEHPSNS